MSEARGPTSLYEPELRQTYVEQDRKALMTMCRAHPLLIPAELRSKLQEIARERARKAGETRKHLRSFEGGFATGGEIIREVASVRGVTLAELTGPKRKRPLVQYRQEAMYLVFAHTELSFHQISKLFHCDHTSVLHGVRAHAENNALPYPRERGPRWR